MYYAFSEHTNTHHEKNSSQTEETSPSASETEILPESLHFTCKICDKAFYSNNDFDSHAQTCHENQGKACPKCETIFLSSDKHTITCEKCDSTYHKKCTEFKSITGRHWKPSTWCCQSCNPQPNDEQSHSSSNVPTGQALPLPPLTGLQRKSNVGTNPEIEFYKSQIASLKSALAMKEAELKKITESDRLKAQRIMSLDAQIREHVNIMNKQVINSEPTITLKDTVQNLQDPNDVRFNILEMKFLSIQQSLNSVTSKVENLHEEVKKSNNSTPDRIKCNSCNVSFLSKHDLSEHLNSEVHQSHGSCFQSNLSLKHNHSNESIV